MEHRVHSTYVFINIRLCLFSILPSCPSNQNIICLCDQGTMWWESVLLTMESTTFPSGKWTWILSAGTLYRCKASVLHQLLLRTDHSRQVPHGHQQQHQHHHLLLGRQAVQSCTLQSRLKTTYWISGIFCSYVEVPMELTNTTTMHFQRK